MGHRRKETPRSICRPDPQVGPWARQPRGLTGMRWVDFRRLKAIGFWARPAFEE